MGRRLEQPLLAFGPLLLVAAVLLHPLVGISGALLLAALGRPRSRPEPAPAHVVAVVPLVPRRLMPRPTVSVAAIAEPSVRALVPDELEARRVRRAAARIRSADVALATECWEIATRAQARLTDAAAVELGLASGPLPEPAGAGPDPVLLAATWPTAHAA